MIHQGDTVKIKPEWQDPGDDKFHYVAIEDGTGGRVGIMPTNTGLPFPPWQTVDVSMLEPAPTPPTTHSLPHPHHAQSHLP